MNPKFYDPVVFAKACWPHINLYDKQREILYSYRDNLETYVPSAKKMGKDFVGSIANLWAFLVHDKVRVILTSVAWDHTDVLWREIEERLDTSAIPLRAEKGGPLLVLDAEINKLVRGKEACKISYLKRMVSETGEKLSGHHAPHTFCTVDEASASTDMVYDAIKGWANRMLFIFNPNECQSFVRRNTDAGDLVNSEYRR